MLLLVLGLASIANGQSSFHGCGSYRGEKNIRELRTTCREARRLAKDEWFNPHGVGYKVFDGFTCRGRTASSEIRFRCVRRRDVVLFENPA